MKTFGIAIVAFALAGVAHAAGNPYPHRGDLRHDSRYPSRGVVVSRPPADRVVVVRGRDHYYYSSGVWYRPRGPRFVVVGPPLGVFVPVLPHFYTTFWFGGIPYYYANDTYYVWRGRDRGYETVDRPRGDPERSSDNGDSAGTAPVDIYVYPRNGQTEEQTSRDRYECHRWAVEQTHFDPTETGGGVSDADRAQSRDGYYRAMTACLEGRGYSVK